MKKVTPAGNLACRFSKGARRRSRIYKTEHIYYENTNCVLYVHVMSLLSFFQGQVTQSALISPRGPSWERRRSTSTKDSYSQTRLQIGSEMAGLGQSAVHTWTLSH